MLKNQRYWVLIVNSISLVVAIVVCIIGYQEYKANQKWKKAEFVAKEIKSFESNSEIQNAMSLLDWNNRHFLIPKEYTNTSKDEVVIITEEIIIKALQSCQNKENYSYACAFVEESFDTFFSYLQRFELYIESGLINFGDIRPYILYWIQVIGDKNNKTISPLYKIHIWKYINKYNFKKIPNLVERFGYNSGALLTPKSIRDIGSKLSHGGPGKRGK